MARLVNKQFNSPIGLYSEQNIREVIQRDSQVLSNGAVGINFHNPGVGKPANLQNSAVLRMLEEEEHRQRITQQSPSDGYSRPLRDQIKWPPPDYDHTNHQRASFKDVVTPGLKRVAWPPPQESENNVEQAPENQGGGPQFSSQTPNLQNNHAPAQRNPLKPLDISNGTANYQQSAASPLANQSPLGFQPATPNRQWAPVVSPQHYPPISPQYQTQTQQYQPQPYGATANQVPPAATRPVEPPPTTITLRQQAPVSQAPPPLVTSQPATATLRGGKNLRGDLKWPPENVKRQTEEENRLRLELAKGPACRPRLVRKDYGPFFAQHALNASYPGYKAPPGTQFYDHREVY